MTAEERRKVILEVLNSSERPCNATVLAERCGVSRQVIVTDIALLRAGGEAIHATPRGYVIRNEENGVKRRVACRHDSDEMERELCIIVDHGCTVWDVVVEHPVYGELTGALRLKSRYDVGQFIQKASEAQPLSLLTEGVHLHTILCPEEESFERVCDALRAEGFLLEK